MVIAEQAIMEPAPHSSKAAPPIYPKISLLNTVLIVAFSTWPLARKSGGTLLLM